MQTHDDDGEDDVDGREAQLQGDNNGEIGNIVRRLRHHLAEEAQEHGQREQNRDGERELLPGFYGDDEYLPREKKER